MTTTRNLENGRGDGIRTRDLLVPNQTRYQSALHPEKKFLRRLTATLATLVLVTLTVLCFKFGSKFAFASIFFKLATAL